MYTTWLDRESGLGMAPRSGCDGRIRIMQGSAGGRARPRLQRAKLYTIARAG